MKIFGRKRDSIRVGKVRAGRAVFVNEDVQEVEVEVQTPDGDRLTLQFPSRLIPDLVEQLALAHEAIHPPMRGARGAAQAAAAWQGMD